MRHSQRSVDARCAGWCRRSCDSRRATFRLARLRWEALHPGGGLSRHLTCREKLEIRTHARSNPTPAPRPRKTVGRSPPRKYPETIGAASSGVACFPSLHLQLSQLLSFDSRSDSYQKRKPLVACVCNAMWNPGGGHHEGSGIGLLLPVTNGKSASTFKHEIEFVCALMGVNALNLIGLEAVQAHHHVLGLRQSCLVELLRVSAGVFAPVDEVVHGYLRPQSGISIRCGKSYHTEAQATKYDCAGVRSVSVLVEAIIQLQRVVTEPGAVAIGSHIQPAIYNFAGRKTGRL